MEVDESKSQSEGQDSQITSENVEGFHHCVKEILNLIEQDENFSEMTPEIYNSKKSKLTKLVNELWRMHGEFADQHVHLIKEVSKNTHKFATPIKTEHVGSSSSTSSKVNQTSRTPEFMTPVGFDVTFTNGGGFCFSGREGSESSFISSSSNSKSKSFMSIHKRLNSPVSNDPSKANKTKVHGPDMLLKKISTLEKEALSLKKKIQNLTDENAILEAEKANVADYKDMNSESNRKIETMGKVIEDYRNQVSRADDEISKLKQELCSKDLEQNHFPLAEQTLASLQKQLDSKEARYLELHEEVDKIRAEIGKRDKQIRELNSLINLLKISHVGKEDRWNTDIGRLKTEVREKCESIDDMTQKHDALMAYTDELKAKVVELEEEVEVISEEKREAIRQLSSSLDHYMSLYKQLCKEFVAIKRCADLTSRILSPCFGSMDTWIL